MIYFDSVFKRWGITPIENKLFLPFLLLFNILSVIMKLYFSSGKAGKKPNQRDIEIFSLNYKKFTTLILSDTMRMAVEQLGDMRRLFKYDFKEIPHWYNIFGEGAMSFLWTGMSFALSKRIIDFIAQSIDKNNPIELFFLRSWRGLHNFLSDEWNAPDVPDNYLIEENLRAGHCTDVASHIFFFGLFKIYLGEFDVINTIIEKLKKVADDYDNKVVRQFQLYIEFFVSIQQGSLNQAQKLIEKWEILFKSELDVQTVAFLGWKAEARILLKDHESVEKAFDQIEWIYKNGLVVPPTIASLYLYPKALYDIILLEKSACSENKLMFFGIKKRDRKSCQILLQNAKKSPRIRTRALRLVGQYHWLINKQNKAVKFWKKAIGERKQLGQRPDLARTYMEIGKRFLEKNSKYKELDGTSAEESLEKAREMFQGMDLLWDLDELDKIAVAA